MYIEEFEGYVYVSVGRLSVFQVVEALEGAGLGNDKSLQRKMHLYPCWNFVEPKPTSEVNDIFVKKEREQEARRAIFNALL